MRFSFFLPALLLFSYLLLGFSRDDYTWYLTTSLGNPIYSWVQAIIHAASTSSLTYGSASEASARFLRRRRARTVDRRPKAQAVCQSLRFNYCLEFFPTQTRLAKDRRKGASRYLTRAHFDYNSASSFRHPASQLQMAPPLGSLSETQPLQRPNYLLATIRSQR